MIAKYYLKESVKDEMRAFIEGFHDVIPQEYMSVLSDENELELIIGGTPFIDI